MFEDVLGLSKFIFFRQSRLIIPNEDVNDIQANVMPPININNQHKLALINIRHRETDSNNSPGSLFG